MWVVLQVFQTFNLNGLEQHVKGRPLRVSSPHVLGNSDSPLANGGRQIPRIFQEMGHWVFFVTVVS